MIFWLLTGGALLVAVILFSRWYAQASPAAAKRAFKIIAGVAIGLLAFLLLTRVGAPGIVTGLFALAPMLLGLRGAMRRARAAQGPSPGGASTVRSAWFEMSLDHDVGEISGRVVHGEHAGRDLDDLSEAELDALASACAGDANSSRLLAAYMARRFGRAEPEGEDGFEGGGEPGGGDGVMGPEEAGQILGVDPAADKATINAAYKKLIALAHPDRGGSAYLAAKINQARDVLLDRAT